MSNNGMGLFVRATAFTFLESNGKIKE